MLIYVQKRDNRVADFDVHKIENAIYKAIQATGGTDKTVASTLAIKVTDILTAKYTDPRFPTVEEIQDIVERVLIEEGHAATAKAYILYRDQRSREREKKSKLVQSLREVADCDAKNSDMMRENANINADAPMGEMYRFGSEASKYIARKYFMDPTQAKAHDNGYIHVHDLDFYKHFNCLQIDAEDLLSRGFTTGHGHLRPPKSINAASTLLCIIIQSNQNDMYL